MIKESLKVHGKRQIEVKQRVSFTKQDDKAVRYLVETYFFLPTALQVNRFTYTSEKFQRSLKHYVRLRPPTQTLHNLAQEKGSFAKLKETLHQFNEQIPLTHDEYENTLKLFALTYKRALRMAVRAANRKKTPSLDLVVQYVGDVQSCLNHYRALADMVKPLEEELKSHAFAYCDEYISVMTTYYLRNLFVSMKQRKLGAPLFALWQTEMLYRKEHYPDSVPEPDGDNELVLYRWSVLKKYISKCLFLEVRRKTGAPLLLHSIYGVAAAISMVFATVIAFLWQGKYGALSSNLFLALVVGYIFKDRIKEIAREKLFKIFQRWIPDRRQLIYAENEAIVGICLESFRFVDHELLPEDVRKLREQSHLINILNDERSEDVLFYSKEVTLNNQPDLFERTKYSIMDISRFNITDFLKYIDNVFEELPLIEDEDQVALSGRIYHIYMIRRVIHNNQITKELARVVITADGIKRLEVVQPLTAEVKEALLTEDLSQAPSQETLAQETQQA